MAEEIVIRSVLVLDESGKRKLQQDVGSALNSPEVGARAKDAGRKIGDALNLGIETTRRGREDKELAHMRRLETISAQSAARIEQIERRKQAQLDTIRERGVQKEIEHARKIERETQRAAGAVGSLRSAVAGVQGVFAALAAVGAVALFERVGRAAVDAAIKIDRQVSTLKALTGSAEAAEKRFAALVAIAQKTPGLTTSLAATLDTQLRIFNVSAQTIDKLLPVIGRLNAISPLADPRQFVNNLTQLISQNFERQDLKELVGQSPIAGQLIKQIFNVDNPTNAEAIRAAAKRLGVTTVERLAEELVKAGENNPALKNAVETLGGQFDKLRDSLDRALAPLGKEIAKTLLPLFDDLAKAAKEFGPRAASAFSGVRTEVTELGRALLEVASAMGHLSSRLGVFDFIKNGLRGAALIAADFADIVRGEANPFGKQGPRSLALQRKFEEADRLAKMNVGQRTQFATATGDLAALPTTAERRAFALATGDLSLLATLPPERRAPGGGGGGGVGAGGGVSRARKAQQPPADLFFATSREFDLKAAQRAIDDQMGDVARLFLQQQKDEAQAFQGIVRQIQENNARAAREAEQAAESALRFARRGLTRSGRFVDAALERGQLTGGEAELLRQGAAGDFANQLRAVLAQEEQLKKIRPEVIEDLRDEIELYDRLGTTISDNERFMRGFNSQIESSGDAFERFGANVSRAFGNVRDLFNGLKSAVLGFFNDLLGQSLQNIVRATLGPIFSGAGGAFGNIFRTPSFAGGLEAPPSVSGGIAGSISSIARSIPGLGPVFSAAGGGGGAAGTAGAARAGGFGGFNFGGLGDSLLSAAPLLGLTIGGALGGQSTFGKILGGAGGLLTSTFISTTLGAPGALGSLAPALFSNPITAIVGAGLLVGSVLLGKASQRRKDEEASGQMLGQAIQAIEQLKAGIASDQIDGSQARAIFDSQILAQFVQGINTLKTKSVRESRLTNQVRDLRNMYEAIIAPEITAQITRRQTAASNALTHSRLIPEFATGGTARGGLAFLHPGEKVLNLQQQAAIRSMAGASVFERAGVPAFDRGGTFGGAQPGRAGEQSIVIDELTIVISRLGIGESEAQAIAATGMNSERGRAVTVKNVKVARTNREL